MLKDMKAMVFAAGIGSRLKEFTKDTPKCLMQAGGQTLLEHVLLKLQKVGVSEVVINVHYLADKVTSYLAEKKNFGLSIHISHEQNLLDTGGGLQKVKGVFENEKSFIVHNSDIYCTSDLSTLIAAHNQASAVATLGIVQRETSRGLYFDPSMRLVGWTGAAQGSEAQQSGSGAVLFDFSGISVCSHEIFSYMDSRDRDSIKFSIIEPFLKAARSSRRVFGSPIDPEQWIDIGTPETLSLLQERLRV